LATESLSAHIGQRIRWARGMVQIFRLDNPLFGKGLKLAQRLCNQIKIAHNRQLKNAPFWRTSRAGGKTSRIMASVPFDGHPCFF
ncbi:hypothetical protein MJI37_33680, partial [Salmonella enterica subsp. enterica serovar Cerro]|nr:hypothetical protein [Salmonella enterica subsp. enterica serovar Cerro]